MKRRITVEEFKAVYTGKEDPGPQWQEEAQVTGQEKAVAGFLRALADEIDPPKTGGNY